MGRATRKHGEAGRERTRKGFTCIEQIDDMGCGAACLRMIERWATGKCREESKWLEDYGRPNDKRILASKMQAALKKMSFKIERSSADPMPEDIGQDDVLYLLKTDCYGTDGYNYRHWIVLVDKLQSHKKKKLVVYADPWFGELIVKPWKAVVAYGIESMYRIVKPSAAE